MPIHISNNPFLKILVRNHSIAQYFQTVMVAEVLNTHGRRDEILKTVQQLKQQHRNISYYQIQNRMETKMATAINTKLNQYLAQWQLTLNHHQWQTIDLIEMIHQAITTLSGNRKYQRQFRNYQPYEPININRILDIYLKTGESIETQIIAQMNQDESINPEIKLNIELSQRQLIKQLIQNAIDVGQIISKAMPNPTEDYLSFQNRVISMSALNLRNRNQNTFQEWTKNLTIYQQTLWSIYQPGLQIHKKHYNLPILEQELCSEIFHQQTNVSNLPDILSQLDFNHYLNWTNHNLNYALKNYFTICDSIENNYITMIEKGTIE